MKGKVEKMKYEELFNQVKEKFIGADVSDVKEHLAFQFNIEDEEAGGAFYVEVKEGELHVEPYEYYDRHAMFICTPDVLLKVADGEIDPVAAYFDHQLRVEGDVDKALRLKDIIEAKRKEMKKAAKKAAASKKTEEKKAEAEKKAAEKKAAEEAKKAEAEKKAAEKKAAEEAKKAEAEKKAAAKTTLKSAAKKAKTTKK